MQCPYCGGWHYGQGEPPAPTHHITRSHTPEQDMARVDRAMRDVGNEQEADPYDQDVLPEGDGKLWEPRVYGTDERGEEVTVVFGKDGGNRQDHTMITDGHVTGYDFYDEDEHGVKGHDHIGPGPKLDELRGRYSGWETFHDPDESDGSA